LALISLTANYLLFNISWCVPFLLRNLAYQALPNDGYQRVAGFAPEVTMTEVERQALQNTRSACLATADEIAVVLMGEAAPMPPISRDEFLSLKSAAAAWGITEDAARKKVKRLAQQRPERVTERGAGR
jgi:hypothetical protein